jgi:predicted transcriptional regulator
VDALLQAGAAVLNSKSKLAKKAILDKLESAGGSVESKSLDEEIASECGLTVGAVQNIRTRLKKDELIRVFPDKDDTGRLLQWNIERTNTPRPPELR